MLTTFPALLLIIMIVITLVVLPRLTSEKHPREEAEARLVVKQKHHRENNTNS